MKTLPNTLTVLRILLVLPIGWTLFTGYYGACLVLLIVAGVSDALDGYFARRFDSISRFGELVDPIADKLLAMVVVGSMLLTELLPIWVAVVVIGREVVILSGALAFRSIVRRLDIEPLLISRVNTSILIVVLCAILAANTTVEPLASLTEMFVDFIGIYVMVGFTVVSGVAYVYSWSMRLKNHLAMSGNRVESQNP